MKKVLTIALIILAMIINQQVFPQKENAKNPLRGEQQIELSEGYSFVSSRIIAPDPDMLIVMASVLNENLDFIRNSQGHVLRKIGPNWVNNIGDWIIEEGYLIKVFSDDSFTMEGDVVDPVTPIQLVAGFQFISYFPDTPIDALIAFESILSYNLDFIRNSQGQILRKIGPNWVNGIGDCKPGEGYLVKMFADNVLIYPGYSFTCGDPFTDPRDEQIYNTVLIGTKCWMAENLNIGEMINGSQNMSNNGVIEKYCYSNNTANCGPYGGLYQWNEIMEYTTIPGVQGICPSGWHLPTDDEWKILEGTVDSQYPIGDPVWNNSGYRGYDAGLNLKSIGGWLFGGNGSDLYGFCALPCGCRYTNGNFYDLGYCTTFWSSSEEGTYYAWHRSLTYNHADINRFDNDKNIGICVRCLQDETAPPNQPPEPPSSPMPEDEAINQSIETNISWTCTDPEGDPLTYDIYFGIETTPPQVAINQTETTYDPGTLEDNTEYFWKIVAHDDHDNTTEGQVWSFTTGEEIFTCGDPFTDPRDEQIYNTVQISDQCWMAENLNIGEMINASNNQTNNSVIEKYCYNNDPANCETYGGLYQWNEMMEYTTTQGVQGICPVGWHIPTDEEWTHLIDYVVDQGYPNIWDDPNGTGNALKSCRQVNSPLGGNCATNEHPRWDQNSTHHGFDVFGFSSLPGGFYNGDSFNSMGSHGFWWSSSEGSSADAWRRLMGYSYGNVYRNASNKTYGFSVRCVRD
jgi:uncharacterized protein (TIGR02145 family)